MTPSRVLVSVCRGWTRSLRPPHRAAPVFLAKVQCCLQSTESIPAARLPYRVKVSAGRRYAWCACGHSKKQPFCDGAHKTKAPSISPVRFTPDANKMVMLCACKETKNAPYCDGSHFKTAVIPSEKPFKCSCLVESVSRGARVDTARNGPTATMLPLRFVPEDTSCSCRCKQGFMKKLSLGRTAEVKS